MTLNAYSSMKDIRRLHKDLDDAQVMVVPKTTFCIMFKNVTLTVARLQSL